MPSVSPSDLARFEAELATGYPPPWTAPIGWGVARQRRPSLPRPACPHGHDYTPDNIYVRPDGRRECRTCKRAALVGRSQPVGKSVHNP